MKTTTKEAFLRQAKVEQMASDVDKILGIVYALKRAFLNPDIGKAIYYGGAFDALEDIAEGLSSDIADLADEINVGKWEEVEDE